MAPQLPELPKLSSLTQLLATPEVQLENMVKAAGVEVPPGPQSTLFRLQSSIEAGKAPSPEAILPKAPKLPEVLGKLPTLPKLEEIIPTGKIERGGTTGSAPPPLTAVGKRGQL